MAHSFARACRSLRRPAQALAIALLAIAGASCGAGGGAGGTFPTRAPLLPTPTPQPPASTVVVPPAGKIYVGANVDNAHGGITGLELLIGRTLTLDFHTYTWVGTFPGNNEASDVLTGRLPIESWTCSLSDAQIVAGQGDLLIQTRAQAIMQYAQPLFITYSPDINLPASTTTRQACLDPATDNGQTFSPAEYVAAWQHIRGIFATLGVTNAVWLWTVNSAGANPLPYYPGNSQVDWIGLDAYDTAQGSMAQTFAPYYAMLTPLDKPIMISETGAPAAIQPTFFAGAPQVLQSQFPQIAGFVYTDVNGPYALSSAGVSAFQTMANDPYFSAPAP